MFSFRRSLPSHFALVLVSALLSPLMCAPAAMAQTPAAPARAAVPARPVSDSELANTQRELIRLLRLSPTLTTVVAHDPSLLGRPGLREPQQPAAGAFLGRAS
jgi:hypothetical protein